MIVAGGKTVLEEFTQSELFQKIGNICAAANGVSQAPELLELSLKMILDIFSAKRGSIFLLDCDEKTLVMQTAQGMKVDEKRRLIKRMGEGIVGRVAASKEPIFVYDIARDSRFKNYKARRSYRTPSFICAPLLIKDRLIGVISISDKECGSHFSSHELRLLDFLSSQIALNLRRIQLYQEFKNMERESASLKDRLGKSSQEASDLKKQVVLQEKLATIGKLTAGIAHEFNNPLDGVIRYTNLCLEQVREDEVVRGYLLEIKHGLHRMANIVKSLLACSRSTQPSMRRLDINHSVDQVVQGLRTELIGKGVAVTKNLSPFLPEQVDLGFERIVVNLLRNAIDAVPAETGRVDLTTRLAGGRIVLEVVDNGCGIPENKLEEIFEPFYSTKDIDKGCGLGLTIVSEIVKSYNGQITVASAVGRGTTFTVTIPAGPQV